MNGQENCLVYADRRNEVVPGSTASLQEIVSILTQFQQPIGTGSVSRPTERDGIRRLTKRDFCRGRKDQLPRTLYCHSATSDPQFAIHDRSAPMQSQILCAARRAYSGNRSLQRPATGIMVAEIEFPDRAARVAFQKPHWLGKDVSDIAQYSNFLLATE
jgi:hypothetical protein